MFGRATITLGIEPHSSVLLLYRTVFRRLLTSSVSMSLVSVWRCLSLRGKQYWPVFTNHRIINIDKDYTVFVTNRGSVRNFCLAWGSKNSGSAWPRDLPQHPDKITVSAQLPQMPQVDSGGGNPDL